MKIPNILRFILITASFAAVVLLTGCKDSANQKPPRLTVLLVVDQMRADHLERYRDLYTAGLKMLLDEGRVYTNAHQDHGYTVTGAGHATLGSGSFPSHSGVVGNDWYERSLQKTVYCTEDEQYPLIGYPDLPSTEGRSPHYLQVPALGDWLKQQSPKSKVFGIAKKDRAAIMMAGQKPDGAYWYSEKDGKMITSSYYRASYPQWVNDFNDPKPADKYFEEGWRRLLADTTVYLRARADRFPAEGAGQGSTFPHLFTDLSDSADARYYDELVTTPFGDELVLDFVKACMSAEKIGQDDIPDLLAVSCSAADLIGHRYGPYSQEALDYYLRLDLYLQDFFQYLDETVGKGNYHLALSSDHGVMPFPEYLQQEGIDAKRVLKWPFMREAMGRSQKVAANFGISDKVYEKVQGFSIFLDEEALKNVDQQEFERAVVKELSQMEAIDTLYTAAEILAADDGQSIIAKIKRSYDKRRAGDLYFVLHENYLLDNEYGTTHGSPYAYDSHIPLIFWQPGIEHSIIADFARSVDVAPTLAKYMGIKPPETVDGKTLF